MPVRLVVMTKEGAKAAAVVAAVVAAARVNGGH
jgi:hypothetical protein